MSVCGASTPIRVGLGCALALAIVFAPFVRAHAAGVPDPVTSNPLKVERPTMVKKHDGGCFTYYPSGGTVKVDCPTQLSYEPIGEAITRDSSDVCTYVPTYTAPGSSGVLDCPQVLLAAWDGPTAAPSTSTSSKTGHDPLVDPPMGGLLLGSSAAAPASPESSAPKARDDRKKGDDEPSKGCGGCVTSRASNDGASLAALGVAIAFAVRRRRARA